MNLIKHVNIGGYPFIIDEDAYDMLMDYLEMLESHFASHDGSDDIVNDIEMRMAELLQERRPDAGIISRSDVHHVIGILGTPELLTADDSWDQRRIPEVDVQEQRGRIRRLFRDPEDKLIGGICSGLSQYFGWRTPMWLRLFWAAAFFIGGSGLLLYLILWIIIPRAKTASDRLAMQGKPININTIADQVEDGIRDITDAIDDIGGQFKRRTSTSKYEQHY